MSVQTEIDRLNEAKAAIIAAIAAKGVVVVEGEKLDAMADKIAQIVTGVVLPELTNPATAEDIAEGKELIDADGNIVTGTVPAGSLTLPQSETDVVAFPQWYPDELCVNAKTKSDVLVRSGVDAATNVNVWVSNDKFGDAAAADVAMGKTFTSAAGFLVEGAVETVEAGGSAYLLPSNVTIVKWSGNASGFMCAVNRVDTDTLLRAGSGFIFDIGEDAFGDATKDDVAQGKTFTSSTGVKVMGTKVDAPVVAQATPEISIDTRGKITASATQEAGQVAAGTKTATKQLTTQAAKTYTPGTADQTIDPGTYLIGYQTIKGDSNLVPENIRKDVSIFGVTGTMEAGSKTVSVTVENTSVLFFDADGQPINNRNGTYDVLNGIVFAPEANITVTGDVKRHSSDSRFIRFLSDGGRISGFASSGGS